MKLEVNTIDSIVPRMKGSYRTVLDIEMDVEIDELVLTALEYSSLKDVITTLLDENWDHAEMIKGIVNKWQVEKAQTQ